MRLGDGFHLKAVAHAGFFKVGAEQPVNKPHCGEVLHPGKALFFNAAQKIVPVYKRIGTVDSSQNGYLFNDRENFAGQFQYDIVGVAVG